MAVDYVKIASGHNNAAGLVRFAYVDPWVARVEPGIVRINMSGTVTEDGDRSAELRFEPKVPNRVKTDALTKCGLTSGTTVRSGLVTVRLPANVDRTSYANYNATATYLEDDEYERGGSGFRILVTALEAI